MKRNKLYEQKSNSGSSADLIESGTLIKRKDGWKLLNGKTSILPKKDEPDYK